MQELHDAQLLGKKSCAPTFCAFCLHFTDISKKDAAHEYQTHADKIKLCVDFYLGKSDSLLLV